MDPSTLLGNLESGIVRDMRVLSVEQVAERLGCSRRQVFYLLAKGTLEKAPRYGRQDRIYEDTVDRALARPLPAKGRKPRPRVVPGDLITIADVPL